jgi:hypothetical protein
MNLEIPLQTTEVRMARKKPGKTRKPKPVKAKAMKPRNDPAQWQERHSPTVPVIIGVNGKRTDSGARRRKDDAELVMDLDNAQMQAAEELRDAYFAIVGEVAVKGSSYGERVDKQYRGGGELPESDHTTHHRAWVRMCGAEGRPVDVDAVHEVVCEGYSCRVVDMARGRMRDGKWSAGHVRRGLTLWGEARPRRRRDARNATIAESCQGS